MTDADPHGAAIAVCYSEALNSPNLHWLGTFPTERNTHFCVPDNAVIRLTDHERSVAQRLLGRCGQDLPSDSPFVQDIRRELTFMLKTGLKFEIEAVRSAENPHSNAFLDYVVDAISRKVAAKSAWHIPDRSAL